MRIQYLRNEKLPPLAWAASVRNGIAKVVHGNNVECFEDCFFEGAWSGAFQEKCFDTSEWFCGTGGKIRDQKIVFSTPTPVTYSLYSSKARDGYWVSNSLNLLMALADLHFDPRYLNYEVDFNTILDGIKKYKGNVHAVNTNKEIFDVQIHYYSNLAIDDLNAFTIEPKPETRPFKDFDDYETRLKNAMRAMVNNAQSSERKQQYGVVTTISRGYDAPCCAAVFKEMGCDTAVTFSAIGKYKDDSGVDVAKQLGYQRIIEVDADNFKRRTDFVEAQIISAGDLGSSISSCVFDDIFSHNIVLLGERGDKVWNKNAKDVNDELRFDDFVTGLGYGEHRLWLDFISVPMPLYGATAWKSIHEISNSEEMKGWSVGTSYDRPIPRRIIEGAGVTRDSFGVKKHGAGFTYKFDWLQRVLSRMSDAAGSNFQQYVRINRRPHLVRTVSYFWKMRSVYLSRIGMKCRSISPREIAKIANPMSTSLLIPWAGNHMIEVYRTIINQENDSQ